MKLTKTDLEKIEGFMMNKARDLELAQYNCLIDGDDRLMVSYALSMYQNSDGGFGHALECDNTCPSSSAIATAEALSILRNNGFNKKNMDEITKKIVDKAIKYIFEKAKMSNDYYYPVSSDTNNYPHAIWWDYNDDISNWAYNPGVRLVALALYFMDSRSKYYDRAILYIAKAVDWYLAKETNDKNLILAFEEVYLILENEKTDYKNKDLLNKLQEDIKKCISKEEDWGSNNYPTIPTDIIIDDVFLTADLKDLFEKSLDFLISSRLPIGVWDITWTWGNDYADEYEIARIKWMGVIALKNLCILKKYKRVWME